MQAAMEQPLFKRRDLDLDDLLLMGRRHVNWILAPALAALVIAMVGAFLWPDTFVSEASIRVVPPAVPDRLVPTNVNMQMAERVSAMAQTILSRNTLTNLIQTYDLYRKQRLRLPMEDVIEKMRADIRVGGLESLTRSNRGQAAAFRISFAYENRHTAHKVTRDLMTRFIDENMRDRSVQSQQTTQFLRDQYDQARAELEAVEQRMAQFRMANQGRLPDHMSANLSQVNALESRITTLNSNVSRVNQEKLYLEGELRAAREKLAGLQSAAAQAPEGGGGRTSASPAGPSEAELELAPIDKDIQTLERGLERLLERYTPEYPDVQRIKVRLEAAKKEREAALNRRLAAPETQSQPQQAGNPRRRPVVKTPDMLEAEAVITKTLTAIRGKEMEAERYAREITDAEKRSRDVSARIEVGPIGAAQLEQMDRDYELARKKHDDLKNRLNQSEMASEVEGRKQGEMLDVLDVPTVPENPTYPNRGLIIGIGLVLGLGIGVGLAAVRELSDKSLKSLKDVQAYTNIQILGTVPLLESDAVTKRGRRMVMVGWTIGLALSVILAGGSVYYYYSSKL